MRTQRILLPQLSRTRRAGGNRLTRRLNLRSDEGFSIVELMVAAGVMLTALTALAGVMSTGLTATGYARQRQSASQLANGTLEEIRALSFNVMKAGMGDADLATTSDPMITTATCGADYCFGGEKIAHAVNTPIDPLIPHQKTVTVGPTSYTVSSYVTYYQNDTASDARRVTVRVDWASAIKSGAARTVEVQTVIFKPSSNVDPTHPFPGPSQAFFSSRADAEAGTVNITGTVDGITLDNATLYTGRAASDITIEQIAVIDGVSQASGATLKAAGGDASTNGRTAKNSRSDNDPSDSGPVYDTQSISAQQAGTAQLTSGANSVTLAQTAGDTGSTTSTVSACTTTCTAPATPPSRFCPNVIGYFNETDGQHCGGSTSTSASTVTAQANLSGLGVLNLAALGPQVAPTVAISDRKLAAGGTTCPTTTGDGCVKGSVTRSAIDLSAGALPSSLNDLFEPPGFNYFARIQGVTDSVAAEAGVGSLAPSASQSAGTVRVYCASAILGHLLCPVTGYVTKNLNQITSSLTTPTMSITDPTLAGGTTITLSATITPGSTATSSNCSLTCTRTTSTAKSIPPKVSVTETITVAGTTVLNTTLVLDPGALTAKATYAAVPL
jgi:type II secretory pathway pseudopilin PulG